MIDRINLARRLAITTGGELINITMMMDSEGDETDRPEEAECFMAGPTKDGDWFSDVTSAYNFSTKSVH